MRDLNYEFKIIFIVKTKMATRYTGAPDVYNYNQGGYDSYTGSNGYYAPPAGSDPRYPVQPVYNENTTSQGYQSNFGTYKAKPYEYKYNLFSLIDEPWNRCCEVGKCGTCPGNECVARRTPQLDWL